VTLKPKQQETTLHNDFIRKTNRKLIQHEVVVQHEQVTLKPKQQETTLHNAVTASGATGFAVF
jgi:hypothetical protein